jgi:hypothetical protein
MTTRRDYSCNLCHETIVDGTGVGIVWTTNRTFRMTVPSNAETHMCQHCITGFECALLDQRRHQTIRDEAASDEAAPPKPPQDTP